MIEARLEQMRVLVQDPTSNLVAAAIGVSIGVIALVLVVLVLLYFALAPTAAANRPQKPARRRALTPSATDVEVSAQVKTARAPSRRIARWILLCGLIGVWAAGFASTSANDYCANTCHAMRAPAETWKRSPHAGVRCIRCHEGKVPVSLFSGTLSRVRSVYQAAAGVPAFQGGPPSQRCLSCHQDILSKTVVTQRAIAMSHAEPVRAGATCGDCHGSQGHTADSLIVGMSACLRCHDGQRGPTRCEVCHPEGVEASFASKGRIIGDPVRLPKKPSCGGCHSQATCDACHGLRMPHPEDYATPHRHARPAAFEGKYRLCYRCHTSSDCMRCHKSLRGHVPGWKKEHTTHPRSDGNGYCLWCHTTPDYCEVCH